MLQERNYVLRQINVGIDLGLTVGAFFVAFYVRQGVLTPLMPLDMLEPVASWRGFAGLLLLLPPLTVAALRWNAYYAPDRFRSRGAISRSILLSVVTSCAIAWLLIALLRSEGRYSRVQIVVIAAILYGLLEAKTTVMRLILSRRRAAGKDRRSLLLVGGGRPLEAAIALVSTHPYWGFDLVGVVSDSATRPEEGKIGGVEVVGGLDDALGLLQSRRIDEVIVAPSEATLSDLALLMRGCEEMGIRTHLSLDLFGLAISRPTMTDFDEFPVATYSPTPAMGPALLFKWVFDRLIAAVLLVGLLPLLAAIAVIIRCTSKAGDPVFFRQERGGLNGKPFGLWKFRSMRPGAEEERGALEWRNEATGPVFKMRDDPRVTRVGRRLRRWSLDELPQLWNVVKGEMSLVGPRPALPSEIEEYDPWQRRRLSMRPGVTCLWQVSGRSRLSFDTWMQLDLYYIDHWSLWMDFMILARTVLAVFRGEGAM